MRVKALFSIVDRDDIPTDAGCGNGLSAPGMIVPLRAGEVREA
jgi:hypothetical protein